MKGFDYLDAPIEMVTCTHSPVPFTPVLEQAYIPSADDVEAAVRKTLDY